jgi:hypothetical protein
MMERISPGPSKSELPSELRGDSPLNGGCCVVTELIQAVFPVKHPPRPARVMISEAFLNGQGFSGIWTGKKVLGVAFRANAFSGGPISDNRASSDK